MAITSYEDMKEKKREISRSLEDIVDVVDELNALGVSVNGSALVDLASKLENDKFKVLVIGEFKRGKSTVINSLIGDDVLPKSSRPCTAVISEVTYGKEKKAMLYFKNPLPENMSTDIDNGALRHIKKFQGVEIPPIELDVDRLKDYVAIPLSDKDQSESIKELPYSRVILEWPLELCRNGIEIIDSPGLNENEARTKVTEEYLNQADAILFVFTCTEFMSASEIDYIKNQIHTRGYNDIFFICNKINYIPEDERDDIFQLGNRLSKLTSLGSNGIFYVNALGALNAKKEKDMSALNDTGIPEFEAALSEYLRNNKGRAKLMQIITPCRAFVQSLQSQHIKGYMASLDQDVAAIEKKIKDAMPKLDLAEKRKDLVEKKIAYAMDEFQKDICKLMDAQYGGIIAKIPKVVDDMDLDNHMTANPFKQKAKKDALEKEVVSKLEKFVEKEIGNWSKTDLKLLIESFVVQLEKDIGEDIDIFYGNLDDFRYEVSGVERPKDISGFERVSATILGTIAGGPMYGAIGASLGFGEIAKRSAITFGASFLGSALLAFTPLGVATITAAVTVAVIGAGIAQLATGGRALTEKYKKQLKDSFIDYLKSNREGDCKKYAEGVSSTVKEKFSLVSEALDNEIQIERSKINALMMDKENSEQNRKYKLSKLKELERNLTRIGESLEKMEKSIG